MPFICVFLLLNFTIHQDCVTIRAKIILADIVGSETAFLIDRDRSRIGAFNLKIDVLDPALFQVFQKALQDRSRQTFSALFLLGNEVADVTFIEHDVALSSVMSFSISFFCQG